MLEDGTERYITVVGYFHLRSGFTFLGSDEDDTIGSTATIDGGSGSILEDGESLNISRVDQRQGVRHTLDTVIIHSETIDDDERVVGSVERRTTTNTDGCSTTRGTAISRDIHTGDLTLNHILRVGLHTFIHIIRFDSRYGTGSVVLLDNTITNNDHFIKELGILTHVDTHSGRSRQLLGLITHIRDRQFGTGLHIDSEITIEIGDSTVGCPHLKDGRTNNRFSIRLINDRTLYGNLRKCSYRAQHEHQRDGKRTKHIQILFHCIK